ncbi:DNA repair protein RecO [Terasakiispira papahanaumokuakeensis]|uniref:DNA repair protein RecO n=1 Tax=Terasakiispira papahanaumokuakeensis TaxID=197479 RepID=A0A1E2VAT5_9GAMM|nr:DNA repair protein RecO [Terasakiispira papahanaumokuakeensis]ODC03765.1 DNA repair protein RecO [Terasakiispira papahanaumokuakeensis]
MVDEPLQPAFLLHARPYRDTSAIGHFLTLSDGRVDALVRGVRGRRSRHRAFLQPFTPLLLGWRGRGELKTAQRFEHAGTPVWLSGEALACGWYANELLVRLLKPFLSEALLFREYALLLPLLMDVEQREPALRRFELTLLATLGVVPMPDDFVQYDPESDYLWQEGLGFTPMMPHTAFSQELVWPHVNGRLLYHIGRDDWRDPQIRREAKQLTRQLLTPLLGNKPLQSRQLLQGLFKRTGRHPMNEEISSE